MNTETRKLAYILTLNNWKVTAEEEHVIHYNIYLKTFLFQNKKKGHAFFWKSLCLWQDVIKKMVTEETCNGSAENQQT